MRKREKKMTDAEVYENLQLVCSKENPIDVYEKDKELGAG